MLSLSQGHVAGALGQGATMQSQDTCRTSCVGAGSQPNGSVPGPAAPSPPRPGAPGSGAGHYTALPGGPISGAQTRAGTLVSAAVRCT